MQTISQWKDSLQQISFQLSNNNRQDPTQHFINDNCGLTYSISSISINNQHEIDIPIAIKIDHFEAEDEPNRLPHLASSRNYLENKGMGQSLRLCINQVVQKARMQQKYQRKVGKEVRCCKISAKNRSKKRRTLSLPQDAIKFHEKSKQRAQTMLNLRLIPFLKQNQQQNQQKIKQCKKKVDIRLKSKQKEPVTSLHSPVSTLRQSFQMLQKSCMSKKLSLSQNVDKQKKYLRKITQNRQNVRHCYPKIQKYH